MSLAAKSDLEFAAAQLNYSLGNPDAAGTIYVSANPVANRLTLVMASTAAAGFTAGTMVPPDQAQTGTGSLPYLYMTPLGLTDVEFEAIEPAAPAADGAPGQGGHPKPISENQTELLNIE